MSVFISCTDNGKQNGSSDEGIVVTKTTITKGERLKNWKCYEVEGDAICCPKSWKPVDQNICLFFTELGYDDKQTFFAVHRYDTAIIGITMESYLREGYRQLRADTVEVFKNYTLQQLIIKNGDAFYAEYYTQVKESKFVIFSMYTQVGNLIYDFSLKIPEEHKADYIQIFRDILYNYKSNNKNIFSLDLEVTRLKNIDFNTWGN